MEVCSKDGRIIAKVYDEKWYANSSILEYNGRRYQLMVRNNPLAEWAIRENDHDLLAYRIYAGNGKVGVKITSSNNNQDYLLDFLLWYLFVPIATENPGDNFFFFMM
ncbi:hypothetical protein BH10BAC3_BH10BAC3_40940 [soil metagenome]